MKKIYLFFTLLISCSVMLRAQIPNSNFESWSLNTYGILDPDGWITYNFGAGTASPYQPAQNGVYALKLTNDTSQGFLLPGSAECNFAISTRPASFDGYYLGQFASQDILLVTIYLYDNAQNPVGVGTNSFTAGAGSFTSFSIPISYSSGVQPDSGQVVIYYEPHSNTDLSGYAVVDNLSLNGAIGIDEIKLENEITLWPNPANGYLNFTCPHLDPEEILLEVADLSGRIVCRRDKSARFTTGEKVMQLSTATLENGMYLMKLSSPGKVAVKSFVISR
jgi:hypothetical protein